MTVGLLFEDEVGTVVRPAEWKGARRRALRSVQVPVQDVATPRARKEEWRRSPPVEVPGEGWIDNPKR